MIPYPYNMVDMGGIDLAEANGTVVEGLYAKIVEAVNACGDVVLYNWKFASIEIAPQHTQILLGGNSLIINSLIQVTEQDTVTILGIDPPVVPVEPLVVNENGVYSATPPASGFNPVTVDVSGPEIKLYTNVEEGESPYQVSIGAGDRLVTIGNTNYIKATGTPVSGAVVQSSLGYKAILVLCPADGHTQDDVKFTPNGTSVSSRTVDGVRYYYTWLNGISGNYQDSPLKFVSSVTGATWDQILNRLLDFLINSTAPYDCYIPTESGFILPPEGYIGFGPLYIN